MKIIYAILFVFVSLNLSAQVPISGEVKDAQGEALIGATILEVGTSNGTISDLDGSFQLDVQEGAMIEVSFIGYLTQRIETDGQSNFQLVLAEDANTMDEIIVVGFAEQRSSTVTAAVSQISAEELAIEQRPVTNVQSALVGSLPGLRGFNATGSPGATPNFSIRGVSSLNGASNNVLVIIDDFEASLDDVNPQDIETVSVLKDAAAVAVYGARGANGVLLITTKKTSRDKQLQVKYNANVSSQSRGNLAEMLDATELIAFENLAVTGDPTGGGNPSAPYSQTVIDLANSGFYPETQWVDELYETSALQHSHNLSLQGGLENIGFLLSAGFLDQQGLVKGNDKFNRYNIRMKIDVDVNDWLTIGTNTVVTSRVRDQVPVQTGNALLGSPLFPVQTVDGFFVDKGSPGEANPIALAQSGSFTETVSDALNMQLYAKVSPIKNLTFDQRISVIRNNSKVRDFDNVYDFVALNFEDSDSYTNPDSPNRNYVSGIPDARRLILTSANNFSLTSLSRVNYSISLQDHNFGALLGFQSIQGQAESFQTGRQGFLLDNPVALSLGQAVTPVSGDPLGNTSFRGGNATTLSLFGRLNYDYKRKYIAELSFRRDGSSNFLENNRFGFFPSISIAWNMAAEPFMSGADGIERLKLRASYGTTGDDSGIARSVTQFANVDVTSYPFGGVVGPGIFLGSPASRDLKWETATILNLGVDLSMWDGRLQMNAEYFINNRNDILDFAITPVEFGFGNVPANLYAVKSWGWEFEVSHQNAIGSNFTYWANANLAHYDNEITDLAGRESPTLAVGQSINKRLGFETDGFFDDQAEIDAHAVDQGGVGGSSVGGFKFIDQDDNGVIDADDRLILERNSAANLLIGFNLGVGFKGFSLSTRFYGALDRNQWWNGADAHEPFLNGTNAFRYQSNIWSANNPDAFFPVPDGNGIQGYNSDISHFIFDNEFIKLQNLTMGYDFNRTFLDKINGISGLNLTFSVENIGTVWTNSPLRETGWDPELGAGFVQYPLPITSSIGLNITF